MGSLSCLNVSGGDIAISFDTNDAAEAIRARRIIVDMLKRGYALMVKGDDGTYSRALEFDETKGEYIMADYDPSAETPDEAQAGAASDETEKVQAKATRATKKGGRGRRRRPMETADCVAVARSAGG